MSVFADRRSFKQIGGPRAYLHQVAWSLWWRLHLKSAREVPVASGGRALPVRPPEGSDPAANGERPF